MPNNTRQASPDSQNQAYDNLFKRLIEGQFEEIVPLLFSTLLRQAQGSKDQLEQKSDEIAFLLQLIFRTLSLPQ